MAKWQHVVVRYSKLEFVLGGSGPIDWSGVKRKTKVIELAQALGEAGYEICGFAKGGGDDNVLWFKRRQE